MRLSRVREGTNEGTGGFRGHEEAPIHAQNRGRMAKLVPHTGIAASLRWSPAEYGCYGGMRLAPVSSDWLEGTNEGTKSSVEGGLRAGRPESLTWRRPSVAGILTSGHSNLGRVLS